MSLDPTRQTIVAPGGTGFEGFGEAIGELLTNIIQGVGTAIAGGISAVGGVFGAVVEGAISLIRGIGGMIASILTKTPPAKPLPELWSPIKADLEGEIQPYLDRVDTSLAESAAQGEVAVAKAQEAYDAAQAALADVQDADGVIRGLVDEGRAAAQEASAHVDEARGFSLQSGVSADLAQAAAGEADRLNKEVSVARAQVDLQVAAGRSFVSASSAQAGLALLSAQEARDQVAIAQGYNTEISAKVAIATQAVTDGKAEVTKAQAASTQAGQALTSAQAVLTDVTANLAEVVALHQVVLVKHDEAIQAATTATNKALEASGANTSAISAMQSANSARDNAILANTGATEKATAAANSAGQAAQSALDGVATLAQAQAVQVDINASLADGVRAAASSAAMANLATMANTQAIEQVAIATQKALDATAQNAETLVRLGSAIERAEAADRAAARAQDLRDQAQEYAAESLASANKAMQQYISRLLYLENNATVSTKENEHWLMTFSGRKRVLTAKGTWVGQCVYHSSKNYGGDAGFGPVLEGGAVTALNRVFSWDAASSNASLIYVVSPGIVKSWPYKDSSTVRLAEATWTTVADFTASDAVPHEITFRVRWPTATRRPYGLRVISGGTVIKSHTDDLLGPTWPWESGLRTQYLEVSTDALTVGQKLQFQIYAQTSGPGIHSATERDSDLREINVGWIAQPTE